MQTVLITGGSGLIGRHLTTLLLNEGFEVMHLSRKAKADNRIKVFEWDIEKGFIDLEALLKADHIIHLAGETVAKYWTASYKREMIKSRVKSAQLIFENLSREENKVQSFISASAVGYYENGDERWLMEEDKLGSDFLSEICILWEEAARNFEALSKRTVMIRTGIVLAKDGGTLPSLLMPLRCGIAPIFGNGKQFYPWIHINDLCGIYLLALKNSSLTGAYNATAPQPARYKHLITLIAETTGRRKLNLIVPPFILRLFLDGFGNSLLSSLRCSSKKITDAGFDFKYKDLKAALKDILL